MTNAELKAALMDGTPVIHKGIEYKCVAAIIYRRIKNGLQISGELLDYNSNSVTIAAASQIKAAI